MTTVGAEPQSSFDTSKLYWVYDLYHKNLVTGPKGVVSLRDPGESEGYYWRFLPAGKDRFRLSSPQLGDGYFLTRQAGKLQMVAGPGPDQLWCVAILGDHFTIGVPETSRYLASSEKVPGPSLTPLSDGQLTADHMWTMWPRRPVGSSAPPPGNHWKNEGRWRVTANKLNGRSEPSRHSPIVRVFQRGQVLAPDYGRGGSDEVFWNYIDEEGNAWMKVLGHKCYVRASRKTIESVGQP